MLDKLLLTIDKYHMLTSGDSVVVGVSGGKDSVTLLHLLLQIKEIKKVSLHIAHLNHCFRGEESRGDAEFVRSLAEKWQVPCTIAEYDVPAYINQTGLSTQEAAREIRYGFFEKVCEQVGANRLALAHNANDQAETVLINFLRGSGPEGLSGIPPVRDNLIIRPLIEIWRPEIDEYLTENKIDTREDSSNKKTVYTRNKIRLELLPHLQEEFNPNILSALVKTANIMRAEDEYMDKVSREVLADAANINGIRASVDLTKFLGQPTAIQRRVLRTLFDQVNAGRNLEFKHIEEIIKFASAGQNGKAINLPGEYRVIKNYSRLDIDKLQETNDINFLYPLNIPGDTKVTEINRLIRAEVLEECNEIKTGGNLAYLDMNKLPGELLVRNRKEGDFFSPFGIKGKKKLKDFLIDCKIPQADRNTIPVVASGQEIIWVAGLRISEKWKVTADTKKILKLEMINI